MNLNTYLNFDLTVSRVHTALSKKCPISWKVKMDKRKYNVLVYIQTGSADFTFENHCLHAQTDDIVYLRKGESYTIESIGNVPLSFSVISFDVEKEQDIPIESITKAGLHLLEMFLYVENILISRGIAYKLCCRSTVETIIYHIISNQFYSVKLFGRLRASIDYIENYYNRKIDITTLASIAGLSVSHYRKIFKETYGIPPVQYINKIRIVKAKDMLKTGLYSQAEISEQCGFENPQYFNRVFKKFTNTTPGEY